jgi:2-polyprenyl-3-methyl-5-hydroxy-6-metoxy-1,4-benzoquinol methylase
MSHSRVSRFHEIIHQDYPYLYEGVIQAWSMSTDQVREYFEKTLCWLCGVYGDEALGHIADGYAFFTVEVNRAQYNYELCGHYERSSFDECNRDIYQNDDYMKSYYWGVFAILFCWPHYVDTMEFYLTRFIRKFKGTRLLEIAPGHAAWGLIALDVLKQAQLTGVDISPTSIEIAAKHANAAGFGDRAKYIIQDATRMEDHNDEKFDLLVCNFLLEHIEQPGRFISDISSSLTAGGHAFITLALTAAQPDHIYEFIHESEAILMAEKAGFRVLDSLSADAGRHKNARYVPRTQALILEKI